MFVNRLTQLLPNMIDVDQVGSEQTRQAGDNTRCTLDLIDLLNLFLKPALILNLDAQKAFDRLSWPFMFVTLSHYGFESSFMEALRVLYSCPTFQVQLSAFLSNVQKMSILLKLLYLFEVLPVPIPSPQLKAIHCWFLNFI